MNPIIVGLDIGTTKIACFVGQKDDESNKVKILGYGKTESIGVENGTVLNVTSTAESVRAAVDQAANQANVDIDEVYVGIAGQHISSRPNQGVILIPKEHDFILEEDLQRLIDDQYKIALNPGEEIVHVFPQTYIVDNTVLPIEISPIGVRGSELRANFHIVTGNTAQLNNIRDSVKSAGLKIKGVVLEPIASSYAVLDQTDREAGVALVDIGGGTTDIAIFQDGIIRHSSVLAVAGNAITTDIMNGCHILKRSAESLKISFGRCLPEEASENDVVSLPSVRNQPAREVNVKTLAEIIKARTELILDQVSYEIDQSGLRERLLAGLVLTGGGAMLRDIQTLADYTIAVNSRIGFPDEHLLRNTPDDIAKNPMYATGIGLVLYGVEQSEYEKNEQEPEPEVVDTPAQPEQQPTAQTQPQQPEDKPKKPRRGLLSKFDPVTQYFHRIFMESDKINSDEDDEQ